MGKRHTEVKVKMQIVDKHEQMFNFLLKEMQIKTVAVKKGGDIFIKL